MEHSNAHSPFVGQGVMASRMRAFDWSKTPLGPIDGWPEGLKATIRILLTSRYAMWMCFGPELTFFCNDAYRPTLGVKQEWALGARADDVWREIWPDIGPRIQAVLETGEATWDEGLLLFLERNGFREETYHTFSYSPVFGDEGRVGGMFCVVTEDSERVLSERRLATLRALSEATRAVPTEREVAVRAARTLASNQNDVPFALVYLPTPNGGPRLAGGAGIPEGWRLEPESEWVFKADGADELRVVDLARFGGVIPTGPYAEPVQRAAVSPLSVSGGGPPGYLVLGLSSRLVLDGRYRSFLALAAGQVASALADARALEAEKRRLNELSELDRAKTVFFNNISHEFRTPLTLLLGPLEEARLGGNASRETLELVHRNALRLQRLVNSLLEFSRLEAGRADARFRPTDLSQLTRELASTFRAAFERAGLAFHVHAPALPEPVYVDRDMWERVVLNLLSNAHKYTMEGSVELRIDVDGADARLSVRDTGSGIPKSELPHLFQRFHRVHGARARTHEGSGIGLALIGDIVRLHQGNVEVRSEEGKGSEFIVRIPLGTAHLPPERIHADASSAPRTASAYVEEASRPVAELAAPEKSLGLILVADDNADMREYLGRVLSERYHVVLASNGKEALEAAQARRPDVVITDVMMPVLDGFELLARLRANSELKEVPVVMLSARAGEEATTEGLEAGADDYLVKPFSSRELLARVEVQRVRRQLREVEARQTEHLRTIFRAAPVGIAILEGPELVFEVANAEYLKLVGDRNVLGKPIREALPELESQGVFELLDQVYATGDTIATPATGVVLDSASDARASEKVFSIVYQPIRDARGRVTQIVVVTTEVTEVALARRSAELANRTKDEFLAMLGHELRNPLAPIVTALHLMQLRAPGVLERDRSVIQRQVSHLSRLVDDLLDVSRVARGKVQLRKAPVALATAIAQAIETASPLLEERRHHLQLDVPEQPLHIFGDATRLAQVVANLITNAAKYTDPGGRIALRVRVVGAEAVLSVQDNGIGIPQEQLPRVFDTFFQVRDGADRAGGGLGLGLALVKSFVELHGGRVEVESAGKGSGSTFTVRLPLLEQTQEPTGAHPPASEGVAAARRMRVLVVDDNIDAAEGLRDVLELLGHEVAMAHDGPTALTQVADRPPELALLDIGLPGMDGLELGARLRQSFPEVQLVAVTGYGQDADRRRTEEAGFSVHLVKPIAAAEIERIVALGARRVSTRSGGVDS